MRAASSCLAALAVLLAGCAGQRGADYPALTAAEGRALVVQRIPASVPDRSGWATDIYAALSAMAIPPSPENVCAVVAVTAQESGFKVDPPVPNLAAIARKEIERHRERAGIPRLVLEAALAIPSTDGRSYRERIDAVKTERELSELFEDLIGRVPLARRFLADRNPVRTGGPMQVSIAFAQAHAEERSYPYQPKPSIRDEVFKRRGGMYFGIAHLLDYPAGYDDYVYRFADFNAGQYASRNAAFQNAVAVLSGVSLALDGDLLRYDGDEPAEEPGRTELAVRALAEHLGMSERQIRRDLERGRTQDFERSRLYTRVFALADKASGKPVPRALVPRIGLKSPKITRNLTTNWFARRVADRYRACLARPAPNTFSSS